MKTYINKMEKININKVQSRHNNYVEIQQYVIIYKSLPASTLVDDYNGLLYQS